jgi:hypothetical protein
MPLVEVARRSSHGIAVASGASTCATLVPLTTLPSTVEVQCGPAPCEPTWTLVTARRCPRRLSHLVRRFRPRFRHCWYLRRRALRRPPGILPIRRREFPLRRIPRHRCRRWLPLRLLRFHPRPPSRIRPLRIRPPWCPRCRHCLWIRPCRLPSRRRCCHRRRFPSTHCCPSKSTPPRTEAPPQVPVQS